MESGYLGWFKMGKNLKQNKTDSCVSENFKLLSHSAHRKPNITNPEYIYCLFTFWVLFPDKSFKLISQYTQKMPIKQKKHFATL